MRLTPAAGSSLAEAGSPAQNTPGIAEASRTAAITFHLAHIDARFIHDPKPQMRRILDVTRFSNELVDIRISPKVTSAFEPFLRPVPYRNRLLRPSFVFNDVEQDSVNSHWICPEHHPRWVESEFFVGSKRTTVPDALQAVHHLE